MLPLVLMKAGGGCSRGPGWTCSFPACSLAPRGVLFCKAEALSQVTAALRPGRRGKGKGTNDPYLTTLMEIWTSDYSIRVRSLILSLYGGLSGKGPKYLGKNYSSWAAGLRKEHSHPTPAAEGPVPDPVDALGFLFCSC